MNGFLWRPAPWWPSWLDWKRTAAGSFAEPLFFHHIAKTGGTSLIEAIRSITPSTLTSSERGDLSAEFVNRLILRGLVPGQFIYGHPGTGAALPLRGKVRIVTLLREPCDQAISNYFFLRKRRRLPDHAAARQLNFREFLLTHPYFAIFQTASLHVGIEERPIARAEDLIDRLPQILEYLGEMHLIGTLDLADHLFARIATEVGVEHVPQFPHRRKTHLSARRRTELVKQFQDLQSHPALGTLLKVERLVYERARSLACAQLYDA